MKERKARRNYGCAAHSNYQPGKGLESHKYLCPSKDLYKVPGHMSWYVEKVSYDNSYVAQTRPRSAEVHNANILHRTPCLAKRLPYPSPSTTLSLSLFMNNCRVSPLEITWLHAILARHQTMNGKTQALSIAYAPSRLTFPLSHSANLKSIETWLGRSTTAWSMI